MVITLKNIGGQGPPWSSPVPTALLSTEGVVEASQNWVHEIVIIIMLLIFLTESRTLTVLGISLTNEDYLTFCKPLETIEV